jgi:hypothetical protein
MTMRLKSRMMGNYHVRFGNGGGGSDPFANHTHDELSKSLTKGGCGFPCTPAMASGLTNHVWSVKELLTYKIALPPLPIPKKRGRPCTKQPKITSAPKKPVVRMRKGALCASTT